MLETSVSFFNEVGTEKQNYAQNLSLIMASKRKMLWNKYMSMDTCQPWIPGDLC
jgi:hypothetical protein